MMHNINKLATWFRTSSDSDEDSDANMPRYVAPQTVDPEIFTTDDEKPAEKENKKTLDD